MKRELYVSVMCSATGNLLDSRYCYDTTLRDVMNHCRDVLGVGDGGDTEPGNSEYSYLAKENSPRGFRRAVIEALDGGNRDVARWAMDRYEGDSDIWWACCSDYQASCVVPLRVFARFIEWFKDDGCETLGTLGGPLGLGVVPDIPYSLESQVCIGNVRATPVCSTNGEWTPVSESTWERFRALFNK